MVKIYVHLIDILRTMRVVFHLKLNISNTF